MNMIDRLIRLPLYTISHAAQHLSRSSPNEELMNYLQQFSFEYFVGNFHKVLLPASQDIIGQFHDFNFDFVWDIVFDFVIAIQALVRPLTASLKPRLNDGV